MTIHCWTCSKMLRLLEFYEQFHENNSTVLHWLEHYLKCRHCKIVCKKYFVKFQDNIERLNELTVKLNRNYGTYLVWIDHTPACFNIRCSIVLQFILKMIKKSVHSPTNWASQPSDPSLSFSAQSTWHHSVVRDMIFLKRNLLVFINIYRFKDLFYL